MDIKKLKRAVNTFENFIILFEEQKFEIAHLTAEVAELRKDAEKSRNFYVASNARLQQLIHELNATDKAMNVLSSVDKRKFRREYSKLMGLDAAIKSEQKES